MTANPRTSRRNRRRFDNEPPLRVLGRAALVVACLMGVAYIAATMYNAVPLRSYRYIDATVPDPGSLIGHDPVRINGARVGQVVSVGTSGDGQAALRLQLAGGTALTADTKILIRANGLLGARYVELVPGTARRALAPGAVIRGDSTSLTYGVTDALDVLDQQTRGGLRSLVTEAGTGVDGQGQNLNDALRVGGDSITPSADLFRYLREFPAANARLLPSTAAMMRPLDANRVALGELFGATAEGLMAIPERRDATRATIAAAPGALSAADSGLGAGRGLLDAVRALAGQAQVVLPPAPAALRTTSALLDEAKLPLRRTDALLSSAEPAVPAVLRLARALDPVLLPALNLTGGLRPIVDTVGPYGCDIENLGVVMRSMTGFGSVAPGGPAGAPMQFRLQAAAPTGFEDLSLADPTGMLTRRESYPPPCKYLSKPYPILAARPASGGAR